MRDAILKRSLLAFFLSSVLFSAFLAEANLLLTYEIESVLENRIKKSMQAFDPEALVRVTVELKEQKLPLPGANSLLLDMVQQKPIETIEPKDIARVKVRILHSINPFPEWLKSEINQSLPVAKDKVSLDFEVMNAEAIQRIKDLSLHDKALNYSKHVPTVLFSVLAFAAISLFLIVFVLSRNSKNLLSALSTQMQALVNSMSAKEESEFRSLDKSVTQDVETSDGLQDVPDKEVGILREMKEETLVALLSDCYWCERDSYAAWIWSSLSVGQRESVLKAWGAADKYVKSLGTVKPEALILHNHSTYLSPPPIKDISQDDLLAFVRKNPSAWNFLTPLRQAHLPIPLSQKMNLVMSPGGAVSWPTSVSKARILSPALEVGEIQESDEEFLFDNPDAIPVELKVRVPTLVWLALAHEDQRKALLSKLSALELASAWVGPQKVLEILKSSVADKKLKLLDSYLLKVKPSRRSAEFQYLVRESLKIARREDVSSQSSNQASESNGSSGSGGERKAA